MLQCQATTLHSCKKNTAEGKKCGLESLRGAYGESSDPAGGLGGL